MIVTFEAEAMALAYSKEIETTWQILIDETRHLYKHYQMYRAGFWDLWGVPSWWGYLKQLGKGRIPKIPSGDIHQRGGDVLIDRRGKIRQHHVGIGPVDRPSVESIFTTIAEEEIRCRNKSYDH